MDAKARQHACRDAFALTHQSQQEMFRADVVMIEAARLVYRQLNHLLSTGSQADFPQHDAVAAPNDELDSLAHFVEFHTQAFQYAGRYAIPLAYQAQQEMFRADIIVLKTLRLLLREAENLSGPLSEPVKSVAVVHAVHVLISPVLTDQWYNGGLLVSINTDGKNKNAQKESSAGAPV